MPHKQEIFADLKRRCERGDQVQVSASVSCQQWWWWMDRGSKPCRTLESTTWGYFEDSGRAVSAEQIPPSYRKMAQLGFRHQDDLHYFGHFILLEKNTKFYFAFKKRGIFYGSAFLMVQTKIRCFYGWFLSVRKW